jgi:hypothetical protein
VNLQPNTNPVVHNYGTNQTNNQQNFVPTPPQSQSMVKSNRYQLIKPTVQWIEQVEDPPIKNIHEPKVVDNLVDISIPAEIVPIVEPIIDVNDLNVSLLEMELSEIDCMNLPEPLLAVKETTTTNCFDEISLMDEFDFDGNFDHDGELLKNETIRPTNPFLADTDVASNTSDPFGYVADQEIIAMIEAPPFLQQPYRIPDNFDLDIREGSDFLIYITQVHSPSRFWFNHFDTSPYLDQLILDMR